MKIVVLDGGLVHREELHWPLEQEADYTYYADTPADQIVSRARKAEAIFTNRLVIRRETMAACPDLRYIGLYATGYNTIDLDAARELGITVCNVPDYSAYAVAQHTMALLLAIVTPVDQLLPIGRSQEWSCKRIAEIPLFELSGKTLGVIGLGSIGYRFAKMAQAMGMRVLAYRRHPDPSLEQEGICFASLDKIYRESDVLSLHCPLNQDTAGLIDRHVLKRMKNGTILLNTARGLLLNEEDVAAALDSGKLYMVGTDVLSQEPANPNSLLANHPRCLITPHVAWSPRETRQRLLQITAENFYAFCAGHPQNVVSR